MTWLYLVLAIVLEVSGTTCMKLSEGFKKPVPSILLFVFYSLSFAMMTLALKRIDVSIAYAVWSGMGTALIATIGILWFREPVTAIKIVSLVLIIAGVVGLNLSGGAH
jgi:small multidrug resistance pump